MTKRRGIGSKTPDPKLRVTPKMAAGITEYRRASLESEIETGIVREGVSYEGSR